MNNDRSAVKLLMFCVKTCYFSFFVYIMFMHDLLIKKHGSVLPKDILFNRDEEL